MTRYSWDDWFWILATGRPEPKHRPRQRGIPWPLRELSEDEKNKIIELIHQGNAIGWPIGVDAKNLTKTNQNND